MTNEEKFTSVISKLRAATFHSRELNALIYCSIFQSTYQDETFEQHMAFAGRFAPNYTQSIDKALALIPKGWELKELCSWITGSNKGIRTWGHLANLAAPYPYISVYSGTVHDGPFAVNRAIAVCIASFLARIQLISTNT